MEHVTGLSTARRLAFADDPMSEDHRKESIRLFERRIAREPLQYILGRAEFYGLTLSVTRDVLIPRPETEILVEEALRMDLQPGSVVVDAGTGSGAIAIALKHTRPDLHVIGVDVSEKALDVARRNAARLGLAIDLRLADMLDPRLPADIGPIDLLASNPPYVPDEEASELEPEVVKYEPHLALFAADDPLRFYRPLIAWARAQLKRGGAFVAEVHIDHAESVAMLARSSGLSEVRIVRDLMQRPRVVAAWQR